VKAATREAAYPSELIDGPPVTDDPPGIWISVVNEKVLLKSLRERMAATQQTRSE